MQKLIEQLVLDFPDISFVEADIFSWSPKDNTVFYAQGTKHGAWSLLHEAGHMIKKHSTYESDIELLQMELEAWEAAKELAKRHSRSIDEEHIEHCIDSYRDWLHQRSKCTACLQAGLQQASGQYKCINCGHRWSVGHDRFCRVYRKKIEPLMQGALPNNS